MSRAKKITLGTLGVLSGYTFLRWSLHLAKQQIQERPTGLLTREHKKHRSETFQEACWRLSVSASELDAIYSDLALRCHTFRVAFYISVVCAVFFAATSEDLFNFLTSVPVAISASLLLGALSFKFRFRAWQIERRELASVKSFISDNGLVKTFCW